MMFHESVSIHTRRAARNLVVVSTGVFYAAWKELPLHKLPIFGNTLRDDSDINGIAVVVIMFMAVSLLYNNYQDRTIMVARGVDRLLQKHEMEMRQILKDIAKKLEPHFSSRGKPLPGLEPEFMKMTEIFRDVKWHSHVADNLFSSAYKDLRRMHDWQMFAINWWYGFVPLAMATATVLIVVF